MACWLEYYTSEVAVQKKVDNVWGGIVDGSRRVWQTPVYVTDNDNDFYVASDWASIDGERFNRYMAAFESRWGLSPINVYRYGCYQSTNSENSNRANNPLGVTWFNYKQIYGLVDSDISLGYNNNRIVYRDHNENWVSCGQFVDNWFTQCSAAVPFNWVWCNTSYPRT